MDHSIKFCLVALALCACEASVDGVDALPDGASFRATGNFGMEPPAPNAPVVATLTPGSPFEIANRYAFPKAPGVGPDMSRFAPGNVGQIPHLRSGDVVAVKRNGTLSRARIVGLGENGAVQFISQGGSPFTHAFAPIPWAAWGGAGSNVAACSDAVADEWLPCVQKVGESGWCSDAADDELDDCASGQDYAVTARFGGQHHVEFECMLPPPHSMTVLGGSMTMGAAPFDCSGSFYGEVTQEPGFSGCEDVYDGVWVADDPDCVAGPADIIIVDQLPG